MAYDEKQIQKRSKITYMILSVIIAIAAWTLVVFANNPDITKTFHNFDVVLKGSEELKEKGLIVVNQSEIPDIAVKLKGKRIDLINAINKTVVEINLSEITEAGTYNLKSNVVLPNSRISVEKVRVSSVPITVEEYKTVEIPVNVVQTGSLPDKIVRSTPLSETVEVSGAKSEIDMISHAVAETDLSVLSQSGQSEYEVHLVGRGGNEYLTELETVEKVSLMVENEIYDYKELPVKPVLHETLKAVYEIDYGNTSVEPKRIGVGIKPDTDIDELSVIIDEYTEEEREYKIADIKGVYIPQGSEYVKISLGFADGITENETPESAGE